MKVLVVSEPGVDGVFRYVEGLCRFLWEQGAEVHLAYSDRRGSESLLELVDEVGERGGRTLNLGTSNRPSLSDARAFATLLGLARAVRPDVIHSHSSKAGFLARTLRFCGIRAVQCYHPHAYVGMRPVPGRFDTIYNLVESVLGRVANTIVVSADEEAFARQRLRLPESRVHMITNGVDLGVFSPVSPAEKRARREHLGVPADAIVLGSIGRLSAQKDPITLYRAFLRAASERPVVLLHVGMGELDGEIDRLVAGSGSVQRVFRFPYTSTPADFYKAVDGFILTSRYEGFSIAALEAVAANLPLILSDAPGNRDLLGHELSHCWCAAPGDVDGFARCIVSWHDRIAMAGPGMDPINHRQIARQRFERRDRYGDVVRLYRALLGGHHAWDARPPVSASAPATEELTTNAH